MQIQPPWKDLLVEPLARDHVVQLYRDEQFLVEAVTLFTGIALGKGEAVVLVAIGLGGEPHAADGQGPRAHPSRPDRGYPEARRRLLRE